MAQAVVTPSCDAPPVFPPRMPPPPGSCDAHTHVFGPFDVFPLVASSVYPLPNASADRHEKARAQLGVGRGVLVQPGPYGTNPSAMLAAVASSGGALRCVAVADENTPPETLLDWARQGVVGLRFIEVRAPNGERVPGSVGFDMLPKLAPAMRAAGLHAQLWGGPQQLSDALPGLLKLGLPLVIDHMAMVDVVAGLQDPTFSRLRAYLSEPLVWIKLTLIRVARDADKLAYARPFHDLFVAEMPDRCLWGSDWPYVRLDPAPDAGAMLDLFQEWTPDERLRQAILVENPQRLFRFEN